MKSTIKNILFISIPTFLIFFFIGEVIIRMVKPTVNLYELTGQIPAEANPMSEWAIADPYSAYTAKPGKYDENKTVNSDGFISTPEIKIKKNEKFTRIVFLGGSSTAGTGKNLPDTVTWPWKTVEKIRMISNNKINIDFINAALGGFTSFESYGRLWSRLRFYKPDIIVVNHGWNDMYYFDIANNPQLWRKEFNINEPLLKKIYTPRKIDYYIRWSQFLSYIRLKFSKPLIDGEFSKNKTLNLKDTFNKQGLQIFRENLRLIKLFCNENKIQLFVCKQPTLIHSNTTEADKKKCRYDYHGFNHKAHIDAFEKIYKVIDDEINSNNIIDLTSISGKTEMFFDQIHPTSIGTESISEIVKDSIYRNYFLKK